MIKYFVGCLLMVFLFFICVFEASAATTVLSNCSQSTVQAAMDVSSDGDIVACPAGSWSWSDVNIPNTNVTLQGAGIDQTIITITSAGGLEKVAGSGDKPFRVTGFTFRAPNSHFNHDNGFGMIRFWDGHGFRFDHNKVKLWFDSEDTNSTNGVVTRYDASGVIDHNIFTEDEGSPGGCPHAFTYQWGDGATFWALPSLIGQASNVVYIEDNEFHNYRKCNSHPAHAAYGGNGAVYVFRHNKVWNTNVDIHPFCYTLSPREFDINNNTWYITEGAGLYIPLQIAGGTGVIYNNTVIEQGATIQAGYWFQDWRAQGETYCPSSLVWDGRKASSPCGEGYPCQGQLGRGQNQERDPVYIWNNTGFAGGDGSIRNDPGSSRIQSGRDYYYNAGSKPGYTPYPYPHPLTGGGLLIPNPPANIQFN
jgi:hypothetical protein